VLAPIIRAAIAGVNAAGRRLGTRGTALVPLDVGWLLAQARRQTGLSDPSGDAVHEPLSLLLRGYETEARLTLVGRLVAQRDTLSLLVNRRRLADDRARHPAIGDEQIRQPLFIVGLPRTGSTLLHHLLARDPGSRVPQAWEVMAPSPPPERARYGTDPRIREATTRLGWMDRLAPQFRSIHPLGAQNALECIAILAHTFLSSRFHTMYRVPTYQAWLEHQDLRPAYAYHRAFLQHLQWRGLSGRWVLKAPGHLYGLEAIFATYPDAIVVQTHRDPVGVLASVASLTAALYGAFSDHVDRAEIGAEVSRRWATGLERAMQFRQSRHPAARRIIDVHYDALVADPLGVIRAIYRRFELPLTPEAEQRMRAHLADHPRAKNGVHRYTLAAFGLDRDDITHRFAAYRDRFGIRAEPAAGRAA
jgi:hypothetical protein